MKRLIATSGVALAVLVVEIALWLQPAAVSAGRVPVKATTIGREATAELGPFPDQFPRPLRAELASVAPAVPSPTFARIRIPKVGLDSLIFEGVDLDTLSRGPGHWPGSALPGRVGNMVIAGHRVTWTRPFYDLDMLAPGDVVEVGAYRYVVDRSFVVDPEDVWIIDPTPDATLTMFACHPKHSAAQRIVVIAQLAA